MISSSAPLDKEVMMFYRLTLGIDVYESYGSTETSAPISITSHLDNTVGHVGGIVPGLKLRLRDIPEMGYLSTDNPPRGEI